MKYLAGVSSLEYFADKCTGCGRCAEVCPRAVFVMSGKKAAVVDRDACMECGACQRNCAYGALKVEAGVGCASAVINGMMNGSKAVCC